MASGLRAFGLEGIRAKTSRLPIGVLGCRFGGKLRVFRGLEIILVREDGIWFSKGLDWISITVGRRWVC